MDAEDYSSSGAKLTWRLINKASIKCSLASKVCPSVDVPEGIHP